MHPPEMSCVIAEDETLLRDALGAQIEAHAESVFAFAGERCDQVVRHVVAELQQRHLIARH